MTGNIIVPKADSVSAEEIAPVWKKLSKLIKGGPLVGAGRKYKRRNLTSIRKNTKRRRVKPKNTKGKNTKRRRVKRKNTRRRNY